MQTMAGHTSAVCALASMLGGLLASASGEDRTVCVWEVNGSGRLARTLAGHTGAVCAVVSLPGGLLASGSKDTTVVVWRVADAVGQ